MILYTCQRVSQLFLIGYIKQKRHAAAYAIAMAEDPQDSRRLNLPTSVVAAYSRSQQGEGYQLAPLLRPDHRPQQLLHPPRRQSTSLDSPTVHPAVSKVTATALTPIQKLYEHAWFKTVNNVQAEVGRVHTELTSLIETERGRRVQAEVAMEELRKENAALKMECARLEREGGGEGAREERALRISLEQKLMDAMERLRSIAEGIYPNTANRPSSSYSEPATLVGSDSEPEYGLPLVKKRAGITGNSREHRVSVSSTNSPPNTLGPHVHHTRTPSPAYESKTVDSSALNVVSSTLTFNPPTSRVPTGDRGLDQWQAPHRHRSDTRTSPIHPISPDTERGDRTRLSLPSSARSSSSHSHPDNPTSSSPSSSTSNNPQTYPPPQRPGLVLPPLSDMYNYRLPPHGNLKFVNSGEGICESPVDIDSNSGSHSTKRPSSSASASASGSGSGSGARPRSASTIHQSSHRGSPSSRTQPPPPPPPPPQHQLQSTFRLPSRRNGDGGVEERCLLKKKRDRNEFESGGGEGSGSGSGEGIGGGGGENSECASGERKVKRKLSMSAPNGYSEGEVEIEKRDSVKEGEVEMEVWPRLRPVRDFEERTRNHDHGEDFRTGIGGRGRGSMSMQEVLPNPLPLPPAPSPVGNRDRVRDQLQGQSKEERSISPSGMALRAGVSSWSVTSPTTSFLRQLPRRHQRRHRYRYRYQDPTELR